MSSPEESDEKAEVERKEPDTGPYDASMYRDSLIVVRRVINERDYLINAIEDDYAGEVITQELSEAFSVDVEKAMRWLTGAKAVRATIQHHAGKMLTPELLRRLCWQISANEDYLKAGLPLSPRPESYSRRWTVVDISGVDVSPPTGSFASLVFRVLAGRAAGWAMKQEITQRHSFFIASQLGFKGFKDWYRFDGDATKLFGLYFVAYVESGRVTRFACTDPFWTLNRKIIRMRHRGNISEDGEVRDNWGNIVDKSKLPYGCPLGLTHECLECPRTHHVVTSTSSYGPTADTCGAAYP